MKARELAEKVGVSRGLMSLILNRKRRPTLETALKIYKHSGGQIRLADMGHGEYSHLESK